MMKQTTLPLIGSMIFTIDIIPQLSMFEASIGCSDKGFGSNRLFPLKSPECRLKPQFVYALDKDADVMTKHLAQDLVDLSGRRLGPNCTAEFSLYHREGSLDIRPLVVMLQEGFPVEVVEVPHPVPQAVKLVMVVSHAGRVDLEGDKRRSALSLNSPQVAPVGVRLVSRDLVDVECLGCLVYQWYKLAIIGGLIGSSLDTGDDVSFDTADKMSLNPSLFAPFLAVLVVEPSGIDAGGKARRINGEIGLYRPQRAGTLLDKSLEQGCQFRFLKVACITGKGREFSNQFLCLCFPNGRHKASAGHSRVDLVSNAEYYISQWESRSAECLLRLRDTAAKVSEQCQKPFLLMHLSFVIGSPFLSAGNFDGLGVGGSAIGLGLPLNDELYCVNVLARLLPFLIIGAGAKRLAVVEVYDVSPVAGLGGDFPAQLVFLNLACVGYNQPSFLSCVHLNTPYLTITISNISQIRRFVNTPDNIFIVKHLTTYILYDILEVCIERKERLQCSIVPDVVMNGFPVILTKNHEFAPTLSAIALTGKNPVRASKRGLSKAIGLG